MPDITLRPARPGDAEAVATIWRDGWRDGHLGHVPAALHAVRTPESFHSRAAQRVRDTVVAVAGGRVAGFVMVVGDEVEQVYVAAQHRSSGMAGLLLAEAERLVVAAGHRRAWLAVVAGNARAAGSTSGVGGPTRGRSNMRRRPRTGRSRCPATGTSSRSDLRHRWPRWPTVCRWPSNLPECPRS
jgi:GNAT superfamily N-acetyltransferase